MWEVHGLICKVGQNRNCAPYMTVYLVISQPKIPCINRIYMVLANPTYMDRGGCSHSNVGAEVLIWVLAAAAI